MSWSGTVKWFLTVINRLVRMYFMTPGYGVEHKIPVLAFSFTNTISYELINGVITPDKVCSNRGS